MTCELSRVLDVKLICEMIPDFITKSVCGPLISLEFTLPYKY